MRHFGSSWLWRDFWRINFIFWTIYEYIFQAVFRSFSIRSLSINLIEKSFLEDALLDRLRLLRFFLQILLIIFENSMKKSITRTNIDNKVTKSWYHRNILTKVSYKNTFKNENKPERATFFEKTQKMHFDEVFDYEWNDGILDSLTPFGDKLWVF